MIYTEENSEGVLLVLPCESELLLVVFIGRYKEKEAFVKSIAASKVPGSVLIFSNTVAASIIAAAIEATKHTGNRN